LGGLAIAGDQWFKGSKRKEGPGHSMLRNFDGGLYMVRIWYDRL